MSKCSTAQMLTRMMPFMAVTFLQFGYAGLFIISKFALNRGMSPHVFVVYRHAVATVFIAPFAVIFDRRVRPKMTLSIFYKIVLLGLLEPVMDQNLTNTGMKLTTATFTSALYNLLPAFAFIMAWVFRLEKINLRSLHSQAKILGTIVTVGGAMLMTLINGPMLNFPWTRRNPHHESTVSTDHQDPIKGAIMVAAGCFCWAGFITLLAITLKSYPAELSLTAWICLAGTVQGSAVALAFEWNNPTAWSMHFDSQLLAAVYCVLSKACSPRFKWLTITALELSLFGMFSILFKLWKCRNFRSAPTHFSSLREMAIWEVGNDMPTENICSRATTLPSLDIYGIKELTCLPGIMCSGIAYYIQGIVMKERGPVFVAAFSPLIMIIVAVMSSFILDEIMYLGRVIGAIVIVIGLYMVLWGKSKDQLPSESEKNDNKELATTI